MTWRLLRSWSRLKLSQGRTGSLRTRLTTRRVDLRRIESTDIEVSDKAREYVAARGGTLFLRVRHNRCCSGGLTFLDASTSVPRTLGDYETQPHEHLDIRLLHLGSVLPTKVSVEMRGRFRPHLVAYWDGCAYRLQ